MRLVGEQTGAAEHHADGADAARRVFEHWVFMLGKDPRRCALGPTRLKAIRRALGIYDVETLELAIEGCAASRWHAGENDRERAFNDIELILRDEAHVERFAEDGERLRERARRMADRAPVVAAQPAATAEETAALRERLRNLAARMRGRG